MIRLKVEKTHHSVLPWQVVKVRRGWTYGKSGEWVTSRSVIAPFPTAEDAREFARMLTDDYRRGRLDCIHA